MAAFEKSEYLERLKKIKLKMVNQNVDVLVTTNPANMNYVAGYDGYSFYVPQGVFVFMDAEEPVWIGRAQDVAGAKLSTWLKDENIIGWNEKYVQSSERHPVECFADVLIDRGAAGKKIGMEMNQEFCSYQTVIELKKKMPDAKFIDASHMINWIRTVKSENEIRYMKQAGLITNRAMNTAIESIAEGVRECDAAGKIWNALISGTDAFGGDYPGLMLLMPAGERSSAPHLSWTDSKYENGQMVIMELGGCRMRYHAPLARTIYVGQPNDEYRTFTEALTEGLHVLLNAIKVGVPCEEVERQWQAFINKKGYRKESRVGYPIGLGYPPDWGEQTYSLRPGDKTILQENMTIHVLAAIWAEDYGYEVSETIVVKENGCEPLSNVPQKLFIN
jgi:Xaa-Pro dipeptidase